MDLVVNLVLAGRIQHHLPGAKSLVHLFLSLVLNIGGERLMARVHVVHRSLTQGVDVLSPGVTTGLFRDPVRRYTRKQVRVFLNDRTILRRGISAVRYASRMRAGIAEPALLSLE